jgi:hypothetical protein
METAGRDGQVETRELTELLKRLSPGGMVCLTRAQFLTAFGTHGFITEQKRAATNLANLYRCDTRFTRERSAFYVAFTRRQA